MQWHWSFTWLVTKICWRELNFKCFINTVCLLYTDSVSSSRGARLPKHCLTVWRNVWDDKTMFDPLLLLSRMVSIKYGYYEQGGLCSLWLILFCHPDYLRDRLFLPSLLKRLCSIGFSLKVLRSYREILVYHFSFKVKS